MLHFPVLLEESVEFLITNLDGSYIDCTFGRGGHTSKILNKISSKGKLTSFDKDAEACEFAKKFKENNFSIKHESFNSLNKYFEKGSIDGILYDLGTCSTHLDNGERGFSFMRNGPLDMRFNTKRGIPLSDWINNATFDEILNVLYSYGDEKHGKLISKAIVDFREKKRIVNTFDLANLIKDCYPGSRKKIHPATKSFQAFRIFINNELNEITDSLQQAKKLLKKNGIIVVISFHSLEDNLVKNFFKPHNVEYPKDIPINPIKRQEFKCIAKKIRATEDEVNINPRSRSAIMRVFKKL